MQKTIQNFTNGNLTLAQNQARRFSLDKLQEYMVKDCGYSTGKAADIAKYLKKRGSLSACGPNDRL